MTSKRLQREDRAAISQILPAVESYLNIDKVTASLERHLGWEDFSPISFAYWFDRVKVGGDAPSLPLTSRHDTS